MYHTLLATLSYVIYCLYCFILCCTILMKARGSYQTSALFCVSYTTNSRRLQLIIGFLIESPLPCISLATALININLRVVVACRGRERALRAAPARSASRWRDDPTARASRTGRYRHVWTVRRRRYCCLHQFRILQKVNATRRLTNLSQLFL